MKLWLGITKANANIAIVNVSWIMQNVCARRVDTTTDALNTPRSMKKDVNKPTVKNLSTLNHLVMVPLEFTKAGKVWCGDVRETREPRVTVE